MMRYPNAPIAALVLLRGAFYNEDIPLVLE